MYRSFRIYEKNLSRMLFRRSTFYSEIYQQKFRKTTSNKSFLTLVVLNLSTKSMKNSCKDICILENCSVSINKIPEIYLRRNSFFHFTILLVIFGIVLNAPILKSLTSASVNHLLETPYLFTWYAIKQNNLFS